MSKLKIAIQKKGRLSEETLSLFSDCGIHFSNNDRRLIDEAKNFPVEILFLRDDDIPQYVEDGVADIGILGLNEVLEKNKNVQITEYLGFAQCKLSLAIPKEDTYTGIEYFREKKIATSYPKILIDFFEERAIPVKIESLGGSVEIATSIGLADAIFDIVSTGSTLLMNGLREVEVVLKSEAVMICNTNLDEEKTAILEKLIFRTKAVRKARENKYILLNAPNNKIKEICEQLPGMKSPTIMPLITEGWSSLHSVIREDEFWDVIHNLKNLGAEGILVIPVEKNDPLKNYIMEVYKYPPTSSWSNLTKRPNKNAEDLDSLVEEVFQAVRERGDQAVFEYTKLFDKVSLQSLHVLPDEINDAKELISEELKMAIEMAYSNIFKFHEAQKSEKRVIETSSGIRCWRMERPIEKVGFYIPGGSAPLFSTILMLGVPATIAGCSEIILMTPPDKNGQIHPAILYTANRIGITKIFKVGGIQAIAALTFGTQSVDKVYKIFGPGNQYVTAAKSFAQRAGMNIDMPAGPSEVLIIADKSSIPTFVAADLLAQAEHGPDSQVMLLSDDIEVIESILKELEFQLLTLPRKEITSEALVNSKCILLTSITDCIDFSNQYAPEHLILAVEDSAYYLEKVINAGSVFLGNYSCESVGDYASGPNHTLPTNGFASSYSGVSLDSFIKKISVQDISAVGLKNIGPAVEIMAEEEGLFGHKNSVSIRLDQIKRDKENV